MFFKRDCFVFALDAFDHVCNLSMIFEEFCVRILLWKKWNYKNYNSF